MAKPTASSVIRVILTLLVPSSEHNCVPTCKAIGVDRLLWIKRQSCAAPAFDFAEAKPAVLGCNARFASIFTFRSLFNSKIRAFA